MNDPPTMSSRYTQLSALTSLDKLQQTCINPIDDQRCRRKPLGQKGAEETTEHTQLIRDIIFSWDHLSISEQYSLAYRLAELSTCKACSEHVKRVRDTVFEQREDMTAKLFPNGGAPNTCTEESDDEAEKRAEASPFQRRRRCTARVRPGQSMKKRPRSWKEDTDTPPTSPSISGGDTCLTAPAHGAGGFRNSPIPSLSAFQENHMTPARIAEQNVQAYPILSTWSFWLCVLTACLILMFVFGPSQFGEIVCLEACGFYHVD